MEPKTTNLAVIIPSHEMHPGLIPAIDSVMANSPRPQLILVGTQEVFDAIPENRLELMTLVDSPDDTSFPSMVNAGIECAQELEDVEWISILEHDDELLPGATDVFNDHRKYFSDVGMFAGLTLMCEPRQGDNPPGLKQLMNEAC